MIPTIALTATMIITGWASQYAPGVMERTVDIRQHRHNPPSMPIGHGPVSGYIAVLDCKEIGNVWWIRPLGQSEWEPHMVADCSGSAKTSAWMRKHNILVEVGWPTVVRWNGRARRGIKIERLMWSDE